MNSAALTSSSSGDPLWGGRGRRSWSAPACTVRHLYACLCGEQVALPEAQHPTPSDNRSVPAKETSSAFVDAHRKGHRAHRLHPSVLRRLGLATQACRVVQQHPPLSENISASGDMGEKQSSSESEEKSTAGPAVASNHGSESTAAVEPRSSDTSSKPALTETPTTISECDTNVRTRLDAATSQIALLNAANEQTRVVCARLEQENRTLRAEEARLREENSRLRHDVLERERQAEEQQQLIRELKSMLAKSQHIDEIGSS